MIGRNEAELRHLIAHFFDQVPRYTSYPTAAELSEVHNPAWWEGILAREAGAARIALYVHVPFCRSLCYFCACNRVITKNTDAVGPYLDALTQEIRSYAALFRSANVVQLHWGGGTPNFLDCASLERLFRVITDAFGNMAGDAERSVEIDPRTATAEQLRLLRRLGFNRLSFGIQDFEPKVQEAINRRQPFELVAPLYDMARELGFEGINFDLIYGLPFQTRASFAATMERVASLQPDRIALYGYAHVPWINKAQRALERSALPTPEERVALFLDALRYLEANRYEHIGMDHFALPGDALTAALRSRTLNRNFMGYTTHRGVPVLGFGMSAISTFNSAIAQNERELSQYCARAGTDGRAISRGLERSAEDMLRAEIIERLLCDREIVFEPIERALGKTFFHHFAEACDRLRPLADEGLLISTAEQLRVTAAGMLFIRQIAAAFDAYRNSSTAQFSQSA